ncbi:MAG: acyl-CoA thioesterase II [Sphingobium sp.]|nr:acyl-CoA thioesterase II [Sphingobium sp.]MCP5398685.1 acyl-CoA thioesterase II [Sphingomonas sp.]
MNDEPSAASLVNGLVQLLNVEQTDENMFRGMRKPGGIGRVYGGQVVAQALTSAIKTVDASRSVHSLHAYFLRGGSEDHEIDYRVENDFDGGSFSNRRIIASQQGEVIFNMAASFHISETGHHHQPPMPDVPAPEDLVTVQEFIERYPEKADKQLRPFYTRPGPMEMRCVTEPPFTLHESRDPHISFWFKTRAPLGQPQWMHRAVIAYASDLALIATAMRPHGPFRMQGASLDHSVWFRQDMSADDWLLYSIDSPWAGQARGLGIGHIFDRAGRLVATVAQEGLMRDRDMRAAQGS